MFAIESTGENLLSYRTSRRTPDLQPDPWESASCRDQAGYGVLVSRSPIPRRHSRPAIHAAAPAMSGPAKSTVSRTVTLVSAQSRAVA